jgi:hypothetical protein
MMWIGKSHKKFENIWKDVPLLKQQKIKNLNKQKDMISHLLGKKKMLKFWQCQVKDMEELEPPSTANGLSVNGII